MRFIHTADWHLGRQLHHVNLIDDQAHVLDEFVELVREERPDAVLIAGDVFDRSVPPATAVELLDDVLARLVLGLKTRVIMIAGNHDGPERLEFGSRIMAGAGLTVVGSCTPALPRVALADAAGPVAVYALPYLEPLEVRALLGNDAIHDHDAAYGALLDAARATRQPGERAVLLAHAFVTGGELTPDSAERPLSLGGSGEVARERFAGFHYVALGHLHRPQQLGETIRYAGSLMKYAVAEADHRKSVSVVELDAAGTCTLRLETLTPRRDLRCLRGLLQELLAAAERDPRRDDYLHVTLTDDGALLDPMSQLREGYPNVLSLARETTRAGAEADARPDHRGMTPAELFNDFFKEATGTALTEAEAAEFIRVADTIHRAEREEVAV